MWGGRTTATPCSFTPTAWAGAASTQVAPEQGAAAAFWKESSEVWRLPRPAVTAPEQTWVIGNEGLAVRQENVICKSGRDLALAAASPALEGVGVGIPGKASQDHPARRSQHKGTPSLTP